MPEPMNAAQKRYYQIHFRASFLESKGEGFQSLFEKLMTLAYPSDFMPCRPWGKTGDQKNDGYLPSKRILFQCYAPDKMVAKIAIKKINDDFEGAKTHWKEHFNEWIFVYNSEKLSPDIIKTLLKLKDDNSEIKIGHWGYEDMLKEFYKLSLQDLESWFGFLPTQEATTNVGFEDLEAVLKHIQTQSVHNTSEVKDVSQGKIEANLLSNEVADFLKLGMGKSLLVENFFNRHPNPTYGERNAQAFKRKYGELKNRSPGLHPDDIFGLLEAWAGGNTNTSPKHRAAVLVVMAYMFDKCEIFEDAQAMRA